MKKRILKIGIPVVVLVVIAVAVAVFFAINRKSSDTIIDMKAATLPTISFVTEGKEANMLVGHKAEMNIAAMRDTIVVCNDDESLMAKISYNDLGYDSLKYEIRTLDGEDLLKEEFVDNIGQEISLELEGALEKDTEALLKLILMKGDSELYYYTRIVKDNEYHVEECLAYVEELHSNMLKKENEDAVKNVMEPNATGNNSTLQHVTIHSDLSHSMWGDLQPEIIGDVKYEIKEVKKAYTLVLLRYQVRCEGDNNEEERYQVKEFFKVSYGTKRILLLEYDRTMEEIFDTSNIVLSNKGVILGIADEQMEYKINDAGTTVAFVQANELWNYRKEEDAFTLVFSFRDGKENARNYTDKHSIQLLSMENDGSMTFSVCGYMNRGDHEGESGMAVYYYDSDANVVKEQIFVPSTDSSLVIEKELNELAYYNKEKNVLYILAKGILYHIDIESKKSSVLLEALDKEQHVVSDDGHLLAYQKNEKGTIQTEIINFAKDSKNTITVKGKEIAVPLGFIGSDFVYGVSRQEDKGYDAVGNAVQGMRRLEIITEDNEVVKTYQKEGVYILGATIGNNQVALKQGIKEANYYRETEQDFITNNETSSGEMIELDSYRTDLKQTQYRFVFSKGITDKKAETIKTKQVLQENPFVLKLSGAKSTEYYYVYGHGKQAGVFENPGDAITLADSLSGVVISPGQNYAWEDGNRQPYYHNFHLSRFTPNAGETTLAACVRKVLAYEGYKVDAATELENSTVKEVLKQHMQTEILQFQGCSSKDMCYLIDKGVPVIALKDSSNAILLIGYDAKTITYIEPSSGSIFTSAIERIDEMLAASGRTFIAYVR